MCVLDSIVVGTKGRSGDGLDGGTVILGTVPSTNSTNANIAIFSIDMTISVDLVLNFTYSSLRINYVSCWAQHSGAFPVSIFTYTFIAVIVDDITSLILVAINGQTLTSV